MTPRKDGIVLRNCPFCGCDDIREDHPNRAPRVYCSRCRVVADSPAHWNGDLVGPMLLPHHESEALNQAIIEAQDAEIRVLREALENARGFLDNPIRRRRFHNDDFYKTVVESIRLALSRAKASGDGMS